MGHTHETVKSRGEKRTAFVVAFSAVTMVLEIAIGLFSNSMALLADGIHMGSHVLAIGLSWGAYVLVRRLQKKDACGVDGDKVLSLSAYTSGVLLLIFALFIVVEAIERFFVPRVEIRYVEAMVIAAKTEEDIASFESYEDKQMFLSELGLEESGVNRLIKKAYALLNLETFITAGEMEVKAWTYHKGWKAPQCAGVIHTDFEKGFIRAEVIKYDDYIKYGSEAAVREAGKLGIEGKDYVVQDGDIMHFRFNV